MRVVFAKRSASRPVGRRDRPARGAGPPILPDGSGPGFGIGAVVDEGGVAMSGELAFGGGATF